MSVTHSKLWYVALVLSGIGCNSTQPVEAGLTKSDSSEFNVKAWPKVTSPVLPNTELEGRVDQILQKMSVPEKVGQILQAEIQSIEPGDIKRFHLGSVLNGGGSMPYRKEQPSVKDWLSLADSIYAESMDDTDGRVAVPVIWGTDAVHGHNNLRGATLFPHNIGLGATRNPELLEEIGIATAAEVRATGIEWVFAPTLAVARNDRWGRTYESYSENPALVAAYAGSMVEGLQGRLEEGNFLAEDRVIATAKHFLGDGGTLDGDDQGNTMVSQRELIAVHNAGYPPALGVGVQSVMASFSSWRGQKMHGNYPLLTLALKQQMGFDGLVVGDWNGHGQIPGCTNDSCPQAFNAGVDLLMAPYDWRSMLPKTIAQVNSGEISMVRLDDAVRRILRVKLRAGLFERKPSARIKPSVANSIGSPAHRAVARRAVRESLVLLKNNKQILPLNPNSKILVAGDGADNIGKQCGGWSVTWQGTGTTNQYFPGATSILQGIKDQVVEAGGQVEYAINADFTAKPDVAIVVFGENPYAEGQGDVATLEFEAGNKVALKLLKKLQKQRIPVVSVFLSGRPLWVNPELNASDAFVAAWLPGTEGGGIADVLFRAQDGSTRYDFKGRLSFSWPRLPLQEKLNVDEKPYDPLFPYDFGLTYQSKNSALTPLPEQVVGVTSAVPADIDLYVGRPRPPWNVYIGYKFPKEILNSAFAQTSDGKVKVQTTDKNVQEDALLFTWQDSHDAKLTLLGGNAMDLSEHFKQGVLSFDLKVNKFADASLHIDMSCGRDCVKSVPLTEKLQKIKKDWQTVAIPVACFGQQRLAMESVAQPFTVRVNGSGQVELANVRFLLRGQANVSCGAED